MKLNPLVLFGLAGALGLVAFLATQQHLSANEEEKKVAVLVAKTEIAVGDPVTEENSGFKEIAVTALPARPITKPEQWQGKFFGSSFGPGEVIVQGKVAAKFGSDSRKIPKGWLVQTINVDRAKSHAGLLSPGDRVDVFGSFDISETDERTGRPRKYQMIKRVIGDMEVWSVGSTVVGSEQGASDREGKKDTAKRTTSTVGMLTTPEQYAKLAGAEAAGKLFLGLRHPDDEFDPGEISFVTRDLYEDRPDQQRRREEEDDAAEEVAEVAEETDLDAFLNGEIAAAPAPRRPTDVPTWTVMLHFGADTRPTEVVDVAAARAAGFTDAQIADKRRLLENPGAAPAGSPGNPFEARFAARPRGDSRPDAAPADAAAPAEPSEPVEPPQPANDEPPAADAINVDALRNAGVQGDGMFPSPN